MKTSFSGKGWKPTAPLHSLCVRGLRENEPTAPALLEAGMRVDVQLYQPMNPDGSPDLSKSVPYKLLQGYVLADVWDDKDRPGVRRYWLADAERPNDRSKMSWCDSEWADVWHFAPADLGVLF